MTTTTTDYGVQVTIFNGLKSAIDFDQATLADGTWAPQPVTIQSQTSSVVAATADTTDSNGTQGTVTYTVNNKNQDKLLLTFSCTSANTNVCTLVALTGSYEITYDPGQTLIPTLAPLFVNITIEDTPRV